jgi:hypothetical protein
MHSPTQEPRHVSLAPEQFSRLVRRQVVEMFSPLPIRRSGQEEAVSADLNPVGKPLSNPVAIELPHTVMSTTTSPSHLLTSLPGFKRRDIDPSSPPVALEHGVEDFELAQSIDELRVLGRAAGCTG